MLDPIKTVKIAACFLLQDCNGETLMTRRSDSKSSFPRAWVLPGGHIEPGETIEEAAIRELREECGVDILY
jgi:8-oxo-dGTP diphosphatase